METVTITEAGRMLGVSRETINKWMAAGLIAYVTFPSGRRRLLRADVAAFLSSLPKTQASTARE